MSIICVYVRVFVCVCVCVFFFPMIFISLVACVSGSVETVRVLLERDANPNWTDREQMTPIMVACTRRNNAPVIRALIEYGAKVDAVQVCVWKIFLFF